MGLFSIFGWDETFCMVPSAPHNHAHDHHSHGPASPHPAQAAPWSILRMPVLSRLAAAAAVSACLWAVVWLAMR
jgi:hypothetical protein